MGKNLLVGVGGKARHVKALYVGVGGKARKVKKVYVGVGGKARLVYQSYIYVTGISLSKVGTSQDKKSGLAIVTANITPSNAQNKTLIWTLSSPYFGFFEHKTDDGSYYRILTDSKDNSLNNLTGASQIIGQNMFKCSEITASKISTTLTVKSADGNASKTMTFTASRVRDSDGYWWYKLDW